MKKVLSLALALTMILSVVSMLGLTVSASDVSLIGESSEELLLSYSADGTIAQKKIIVPKVNSSAKKLEIFSQKYIPGKEIPCAIVVPPIIDSDPIVRTRMESPDEKVGKITMYFNTNGDNRPDSNGTTTGTATLIGKDILLSCAHCVWNPQYKNFPREGWPVELVFEAGKHGADNYVFSSEFVTSWIPQEYVDHAVESEDEHGRTVYNLDQEYDWSIIQIEDNLGDALGYYDVRLCGSEDLNEDVYTIGYPGDMGGETQWKSEGEITGVYDNLIYYDVYLYYGNSGGAIFDSEGIICGLAAFRTENGSGIWLGGGGPRIYSGLYWVIQDAFDMAEERWE